MRTLFMLLAIANLLPATGAHAQKALTGEDAAYVDWAVKNCAAKSTDQARTMVSEASAKGKDAFSRAYTKLFESKLTTALDTPARQTTTCSAIKGWYGPEGDRIAGLLKYESTSTPSQPPPEKRAAPAAAPGVKHGMKR